MIARKLLFILLSLLVLTSCSASYADIIYVKSGGVGPDGLSWATAFGTIQAGITAAAAQPEKTVWVATGTYTENITLSAGILLYGGFAGTEGPLDPNVYANRDFVTNETRIHPAVAGTSIASAAGGTRIDGFTIENGTADLGGAIVSTGNTCIIANNIIQNNAARLGGGVYGLNTSFSISECTFLNNTAADSIANPGIAQGGGIWVQNGNLLLTHSTFQNQLAQLSLGNGSSKGGAIYVSGGTLVRVDRCTFNNCVATGTGAVATHQDWGGAMYISGVNANIYNCFIYKCAARGAGNIRPAFGGGIAFQNQGNITIINNTFYGDEVTPNAGTVADINRPYGLGASIYVVGSSTANIYNNIISYSRGTAVVNEGMIVKFNYNLLWHNAGGDIFGFNFPVPNPGLGIVDANIMKDPQFRNVASNDYHILYGSPAKNAGTKSGGVPAFDIDGEARFILGVPVGGAIDIGADEFIDTDNDGGANTDPTELTPLSIDPPEADPDGDGIYTPYDNCPATANPTQIDSNGDKVGDSCTGAVLVYYVDGGVASSGDGTTWATAFKTIQEAINAADLHNMAGWTQDPQVWVKAGTYFENILIWHGVQVYGGWAGTESPLTPDVWSGRVLSVNTTTINGGALNTTVVIAQLPQDRYLTGTTKTNYDAYQSVIDGFTITNGKGELGGGLSIYKEAPNASADVIQNSTAALGGGVYAYRSTGIVGDGIGPAPGNILTGDTAISGNTATGLASYAGYGGGAYFEGGSPLLFANLIRGNTAFYGGGVAARSSGATLIENVIGCQTTPNTATGTVGDGRGGGVYLENSAASFNMDTIVDNLALGATGQGGGIWASNSNFWMRNSIVAFNTAVLSGGAIFGVTSTPIITYSDFWLNSLPQFVGITDPTTQPTNLAVDPLFTDRATCNYRLAIGSPLIGAGDPADGSPNIGAFQDEDPPVSIGEALKMPNGVMVQISGGFVTAVFDDGFYMEQQNRAAGIKVIYPKPALRLGISIGDLVDVEGVITQLGGNKMIINATVTKANIVKSAASLISSASPIIAPLGVSNRQFEGAGLNCIGLLVKTWGKAGEVVAASNCFFIDDGSGVKVKVIVPSDFEMPSKGSFVIVTGIACKEETNGKLMNVLKARFDSDIVVPQK